MCQVQVTPAKISRPLVQEVYPRERLFDRLDRMAQQPVTWISGPAGYGKSILVNSYLKARGQACLWYQMDEGDGEPASFFHYLGLAAGQAAPAKHPLPQFKSEYLPSLRTFALRFFECLYQRLGAPCVLVFDNVQEVPADSAVHELLALSLSRLTANLRVVFISRQAPSTHFTRLRANRRMLVLGRNDLRLSIEEAQGIARLVTGKLPSEEKIVPLHDSVDGWAAGLVLALETAKRETIDFETVVNFGAEEIFDYFAGEIFDKMDRKTRAFLIETAVLPHMTARMAQSLTGLARAGRLLSRLHKGNHFTERRFGGRPSYQYHPLFKRFLQTRAERQLPPEALSRQIGRASCRERV